MNALIALIIKDLNANRKALMVPIWYLLGSYTIMTITMLFASASGKGDMSMGAFPVEWLQNPKLYGITSFAMQAGIFFSFLAFVFAVCISITSSTMLNQDIKYKSEIFHRSQPVSIWQITGARYIAGVIGPLALAFVIGIINMLLFTILVSMITPLHVNLWMSLNGFLLSWLHFSALLMVFGSILFVFSGMFRENAFGLGLGGLGVLHVLAYVLNEIYGWKIPYILKVIYNLLVSGFIKVQSAIPTPQQFGLVISNQGGKGIDYSTFVIPSNFLPDLWATLFTWEMAFKLLLCIALFGFATFLYQKRDVQF